MMFGEILLDDAVGAILAHSLKIGQCNLKKGRKLSASDVEALKASGRTSVVAARLEPGDVHEDEAATAVARALCGPGLTATAAFTGRCNLLVDTSGLLVVDGEGLAAINSIDEAVTVASLPAYEQVTPKQMAATIKIIPFAVPRARLENCLTVAKEHAPLLRVATFVPRRVGLVQTSLPGMKPSILEKTAAVIDARLEGLGCSRATERRCAHEIPEVAEAIIELRDEGCELILISGASAIVDRRDVVPAAIVAAGGSVDHFGMPVDPGNLMLIGHDDKGALIGLPGCARSPKINGFDWVLQRLIARLPVTSSEIMSMGVGGLLKEISSRPLPRAEAVEKDAATATPRLPRIGALVLAAGRSTRMGGPNKLLIEIDGKAMLAHVVDAILASQVEDVVVVTGHQEEAVRAALASREVRFVHNPDYAQGLATSLRAGLSALPRNLDGALVCLGDMPRVGSLLLDKLIAAFNPTEGRAICVPIWQGKRGNPVLFAQRFFAEMQTISGDTGAKSLIGAYSEQVAEVEMPDRAILDDFDTPEAVSQLTG